MNRSCCSGSCRAPRPSVPSMSNWIVQKYLRRKLNNVSLLQMIRIIFPHRIQLNQIVRRGMEDEKEEEEEEGRKALDRARRQKPRDMPVKASEATTKDFIINLNLEFPEEILHFTPTRRSILSSSHHRRAAVVVLRISPHCWRGSSCPGRSSYLERAVIAGRLHQFLLSCILSLGAS